MSWRDKAYRIWWFTPSEIEQQESWLSDMAAQGLHLEDVFLNLAVFKRGERSQMRYRCEAVTELSEDQREIYEMAGWEYVASRRNIHVFRAPTSQDIPEIHTDTEEQAKMLRGFARSLCYAVLSLLFSIALVIGVDLWQQTLMLRAIIDLQWWGVALALLIGLAFYFATSEAVHVLKLARGLRQGRPLDHNVRYERVMTKRRLSAIILTTLTILGVGGWMFQQHNVLSADRFPPVPSGHIPVVTIGEILTDAGKTDYRPFVMEPMGNVFDYYRVTKSLLLKEKHDLQQYFIVEEQQPNGDNHRFAKLHTAMFRTRSEIVAEVLAEELAKKGLSWKDHFVPEAELASAAAPLGIDGLWMGESAFILRRRDTVYYVIYTGVEPIGRVFELTLDKARQGE